MCRRLRVDLKHARLSDFKVNGDDAVEYLIGGDLTRIGSDHDFHLSHTYALSQLKWAEDRHSNFGSASLDLPPDHVYAVPGNHDHWKGITPLVKGNIPLRRPPAYNPMVFPDFLEATPWRHTLWSSSKAFALELYGVDSNEGLKGKATNFRAGGQISPDELKRLRQHLIETDYDRAADGKPRLKAIACHHAFSSNGGLADAWPLSNQSRQDLIDLARAYEVRAILTGHTHYFLDQKWQQPKQPIVWELRCGSTLQRGKQPQPQGFWAHEISQTGDPLALKWSAWKYQWGGTQFLRNSAPVDVTVQ